MKVILTEDVASLGSIGSIVTVKDGFARNYLIPRSIAVLANESNQKELNHRKRVLENKKNKILVEIRSLASKIEKLKFEVQKLVGDEGKIFGSVTTAEIADFYDNHGIKLSKKDIKLPDDMKKVGSYEASIKLHTEVTAKISIQITAQAPVVTAS
jgi:large subunit ribosomal protein L9